VVLRHLAPADVADAESRFAFAKAQEYTMGSALRASCEKERISGLSTAKLFTRRSPWFSAFGTAPPATAAEGGDPTPPSVSNRSGTEDGETDTWKPEPEATSEVGKKAPCRMDSADFAKKLLTAANALLNLLKY
jgi:hypothetical protein